MARQTPTPSRQRYFERWTYDARILAAAFAVAAPAAALLVVVLIWGPLPPGLLTTLLCVAALRRCGSPCACATASSTRCIIVEPARGAARGDFSLRGARALPRRSDRRGDLNQHAVADASRPAPQGRGNGALLTKVIGATDIAIFTFDSGRRLRLVNPAGERLLARSAENLLGRTADELGIADCLALEDAQIRKRAFPGGSGRFEVRRARFREGGVPHELLVVADLSRALREEERAAWQRLLRVLGHELNNSLTPIRSMTATLAKLLGQQPPPPDWRDDVSGGLAVIGDRAEALTRFMAGYTALARLPPPNKREIEIGELVRRVARLEQRVEVVLAAAAPLPVRADPDQLEQALINLTKNAADATLPLHGGVRVRWQRDDGAARIEIEDDGPGIGSTENLFIPFYTTKPGGSGIGLVLARQIAEAHGGMLTLENRAGVHGCIARLILPLA
jgi:nitrogen fixation/metabolism regulation signal transduction histidine kinase